MAGEDETQKTEIEKLRGEVAELKHALLIKNDTEIEPEAAAIAGAIHALADALTLHARAMMPEPEEGAAPGPGTLDA